MNAEPAGSGDPRPRSDTINGFTEFFKRYINTWAALAVLLPTVVTLKKAIPVYEAYKGVLATVTTIACLLVLAFLFYCRHRFAVVMFRRDPTLARGLGTFPLLLIAGAIGCAFLYTSSLSNSIVLFAYKKSISANWDEILEHASLHEVPNATALIAYYVGMFLFAEASLFFMAFKEYVQDLMRISDAQIFSQGSSVIDSAEIHVLATDVKSGSFTKSSARSVYHNVFETWAQTTIPVFASVLLLRSCYEDGLCNDEGRLFPAFPLTFAGAYWTQRTILQITHSFSSVMRLGGGFTFLRVVVTPWIALAVAMLVRDGTINHARADLPGLAFVTCAIEFPFLLLQECVIRLFRPLRKKDGHQLGTQEDEPGAGPAN